MKYALLAALAVILMAGSAWAIQVDFQDYMKQVGVRLATDRETVEFAEGQTIAGTVATVATLERHGLKGIKLGDELKITHIKDWRFKLMHVPSGASVEITYKPKK